MPRHITGFLTFSPPHRHCLLNLEKERHVGKETIYDLLQFILRDPALSKIFYFSFFVSSRDYSLSPTFPMSKLNTLLKGNSFHTTQCPHHNFIGPTCSGKDSFSRRSEPLDISLSLNLRFYLTSDQGCFYFALSFLTGVKTSAATSFLNSYHSHLWFWSVTIPSSKLVLLVCWPQMN